MLQLPNKTLYAIEAVVDIACHARPGPVQAKEIAKRQGIPRRYLEPVMQKLVRAGVLRGVRGPKGGYRLARERRRITVGELVGIFLDAEAETTLKGSRTSIGLQVVQPLWREIEQETLIRLGEITIEDLCRRATEAGVATENQERGEFSI